MLLAVIGKLASCEKWHRGRGAEIWLGYTPFKNPQIWLGQNNSFICGANNVVEHFRKIIETLYGCPFEGWPNRVRPNWQKWLGWPCPVRSALKRTTVKGFIFFPKMFYYVISTTYKNIGDIFCCVHLCWFSNSVGKIHQKSIFSKKLDKKQTLIHTIVPMILASLPAVPGIQQQ